MIDWLRKLLTRIIGYFFKEPEPDRYEDTGQALRRRYQEAREARTTIRPSDAGFRKLNQHSKGRRYDRRSGFDPNKRMADIEDGDTRPPRKKRGWAEDKVRRNGSKN